MAVSMESTLEPQLRGERVVIVGIRCLLMSVTRRTIVKKRRVVNDEALANPEAAGVTAEQSDMPHSLQERLSEQDEAALEVLASFMQKW
jgi:hypothetical protein